MNEMELYKSLWDRSKLLFSDDDRAKLKKATVAIAGLGGIGCVVSEMLVRTGVGHFKLADPGLYDPTDLGRQLFATTKTLGQNKAEVAKERLLEINPYCHVEIYTRGVQKDNIFEILKGTDILCDQSDAPSQIIIQSRAAQKRRIPLVTGARSGFPGKRWTVGVKIWDFKRNTETQTWEEANRSLTQNLTWDELTEDVLNTIDKEFLISKELRIREKILNLNTTIFGNVSLGYLMAELDDDLFFKKTICAPIANLAGILSSLEVIKLLLGWKTTTYKLNILDGHLEE
jgi:hypothetical protein